MNWMRTWDQMELVLEPGEEAGKQDKPGGKPTVENPAVNLREETPAHGRARQAVEAEHPELVIGFLGEETDPKSSDLVAVIFKSEEPEASPFKAPRFFRAVSRPAGGWDVEEFHPNREETYRLMTGRKEV
jgi:hypothetical protein